jgi:hypothetical protein
MALVRREPVKFWWVWTKTGSTPTTFHESEEEALYEAARLARKHPDRKFIVLKAYAKISVRMK